MFRSDFELLILTKHYGDFRALIDLDLEVERGEVFGFLGPNGAGKTTAIRTLTDEIRPTGGTASIVGRAIHRARPAGAGRVPHDDA